MECKECNRLKQGIYAVVAALVNGNQESALKLARAVMYGGSVNNPLDVENPKRHLTNQSSGRDNACPECATPMIYYRDIGWECPACYSAADFSVRQ